jgi:hypothetical protein
MASVDAVELRIRRKNVDLFIKAKQETITLTRQPKLDAGNGGWKYGVPVDLDPQPFRIMSFKRRLIQERVPHEILGNVIQSDDILIGHYNADVQERDTFTLNGVPYEVKFVDQERTDHTLAAIVNRSED